MKDFYYILGISKNSTIDEIKSAYRKLSKKFHPDLNNGDKFFEDRFKEIQEAYETLSNINKRKLYDELFDRYKNPINADNSAYQANKPKHQNGPDFNHKETKNEKEEQNLKFNNDLKSKVGKNIKETKSFIQDAWENERIFSILFILTFIFWNIVFLNMHSQKNELNIGNFLLTPIISAILALIVAGILAKIINSVIDIFSRN